MKIICKQKVLSNAITSSQKAITNRTTMPILECLLIEASANTLNITGNNLELSIRTTIQANVLEPGKIAINVKLFSEIIRKLPSDSEIQITTDENLKVAIKCGKAEYILAGLKADEYPEIPEVEMVNPYKISKINFKNLIRQTIFAVGTDESKILLTGELLEIRDNNVTMVAVDGFRLSVKTAQLNATSEDINVIIPGKSLGEINKIIVANDEDEEKPDSYLELYFTDKHARIEMSDTVIVTRLLDGEFLNYKSIFSNNSSTQIKLEKNEFIHCIERASLISRHDSNNTPVKIIIEGDRIIINSVSNVGSAYEEMNIEKNGENVEVAFNPVYLLDALKAIDEDELIMKFGNSYEPCILLPLEGENYKYLILPVKLN